MRLILFRLIFIQTEHTVCVSANTFPLHLNARLIPPSPRNHTKADASGCNFEAPARRPPRLTSLFFLIDPGSSRDWDNIFVKLFSFLGESHFHISPLHALFITSLQLPCKRHLNCHPSLLLNSLVNIKPYLLLINPQLKKKPFLIYKLFTPSKAWGVWAPSI